MAVMRRIFVSESQPSTSFAVVSVVNVMFSFFRMSRKIVSSSRKISSISLVFYINVVNAFRSILPLVFNGNSSKK